MKLCQLDHIFIRARDVEKSKDFYTKVLRMEVGYRPPFKFHGYWLYIEGRAAIHLFQAQETNKQSTLGKTGIGHVAFMCKNYDATIHHLDQLQVPYDKQIVPEEDTKQIFITDPDDIRIELNFSN